MGSSEKEKRKHLCLTIPQKVKLLEQLDRVVSLKCLTEEFSVEKTTTYDIKKQKNKLLKLYNESDHKKLTQNRKTQPQAKNEDLGGVLMEWIGQCRNEHICCLIHSWL